MRSNDQQVHGSLKHTSVFKVNEDRPSTHHLMQFTSHSRLDKMDNKPVLPRFDSWERLEETNPFFSTSYPTKTEVDDFNILEQEVDKLKRVVTQQNQVLQSLGARL